VKIALGQINPTVGDFSGNASKIVSFSQEAKRKGADLILFPELSICGYPPRDLVEKPSFVLKNQEVLEQIAHDTEGISVICGLVTPAHADTGKSVMNSAALLANGRVKFLQSKMLLPNYDVFDEQRYFAAAPRQHLVPCGCEQLALTICEDAWNDKHFWQRRLYSVDPVDELLRAGGSILLNISASPFHMGKRALRQQMLAAIATHHKTSVVFVNQVGGNDSLVFDGSSMVIAPNGKVVAQARSFEEDLVIFDHEDESGDLHEQQGDEVAAAYEALVLGTRDYIRKCGFRKVVIGLSGGIDSALTAAIAVDALGKENVLGIGMPSPYSSQGSIDDSRELAANLGVQFELLPIDCIFKESLRALAPMFRGYKEDLTEENLQARIRGDLLMALSNKFNALVLTTGNKSEMAVGYCTLYGDMVGALAVLGDVSKTLVYKMSRYCNRARIVIPQAIIDKPPSAELRPGQKDSDSLPSYDVLDPIIAEYIEEYKTAEQIAEQHGLDLKLVRSVVTMIERSEYKRQQAAPNLKITQKAFGVGRRFPIAVKNQI